MNPQAIHPAADIDLTLQPRDFAAIVAEAARYNRPTAYATDLRHDQRQIATQQPREFLWALREHGTWIIPAGYRDGSAHDHPCAVSVVRTIQRAEQREDMTRAELWFHVRDGRARKISREQAIEHAARYDRDTARDIDRARREANAAAHR